MSFLTGSAPKVQQLGPQPTISGNQTDLLNTLGGLYSGWLTGPNAAAQTSPVPQYPAQTVAPQTAGQTGIIQQLLGIAGGVPTSLPGNIGSAASTLLGNLGTAAGFQGPQVTAPQTSYTPGSNVVSPQAATDAFTQGVVKPVTSNFLQNVIPQLNAGAGRSAGGIYSSDLAGATNSAVSNLNQELTGAGSQYALQTQLANQGATTSQQNLLGQLALGNLGAQQQTNQLNVGSALSGQGLDIQAMGQTPGAINAGIASTYAPSSYSSEILSSLFPTISTPQTTQEQGLQTLIQELTGQSSLYQNFMQQAGGLSTASTQQPQTVVTGGQSGILGNLLGGLAGNTGVTNAIGSGISSLFAGLSDERAKEDIRPLGRTNRKGLPVYTFRYKGEPLSVTRVGLLAQDVEQVYPEAVGRLGPFKTVDYAAVGLAERFPEKKAA